MAEAVPRLKLCPGCNTVKSRFPLSSRKATRHGVKTYLKTRCRDCTRHQARVALQLHKLFTAPPPYSHASAAVAPPSASFSITIIERKCFVVGFAESVIMGWGF